MPYIQKARTPDFIVQSSAHGGFGIHATPLWKLMDRNRQQKETWLADHAWKRFGFRSTTGMSRNLLEDLLEYILESGYSYAYADTNGKIQGKIYD